MASIPNERGLTAAPSLRDQVALHIDGDEIISDRITAGKPSSSRSFTNDTNFPASKCCWPPEGAAQIDVFSINEVRARLQPAVLGKGMGRWPTNFIRKGIPAIPARP